MNAFVRRSPIRRIAAGLVALLALTLAAALPAAAQPAPAIGEIRVDVSPLRSKGVGNYADILKASLERALTERFADRRARDGARLTVVLDLFLMTSYGAGESTRDAFGSGVDGLSVDELGGEAVLTDDGRVLARTPLRVVLPPEQSGAWYVEGFEVRRAVNLAETYAGWLARKL